MSFETLLPCPFCGGEPEEDAGGCIEYHGHEHQDYSITCKQCGAEVYCSVGAFEKADAPCSCHHDTRKVCVDKWNKRAAIIQAGNSPVIPGAEQRIADAVELLQKAAPAMLADNSGPDGPLAGRMKSPVIPDGLIAAVNRLLDSDGSRGCYSAIRCYDARAEVERLLAAAPQPQNAPQNIPEIIPGWIPVSERMPEDDDFVYIWPRPDFGVDLHVGQYCERSPKGEGWYAQVYEQNYGIEWFPINVTHWMPLPAAPQEVPDGKV